MVKPPFIENLLGELKNCKTEGECVALIVAEYKEVKNYFVAKGHDIQDNVGFMGQQKLDATAENLYDFFLCQYFNVLNFLGHGFTNNNWNTGDRNERKANEALRDVIIEIIESKKQK